MAGQRLYKREKLCSLTAITTLFAESRKARTGFLAYPLRVVYRVNDHRADGCKSNRFLISVPKKKIRHAVDRVLVRRRCREAYRLNRNLLSADQSLDMAFMYVADSVADYAHIEKSMRRLLSQIEEKIKTPTPQL